MCRSKDDPRGYYRCSGYNHESRRARRAANNLYRKTLADAVAAQGHDDLADKVRRAPMSAMPALTAAAGFHPIELVGPTARVPGVTKTHRIDDEAVALVSELGEATGTGAVVDPDTDEVTVAGAATGNLDQDDRAGIIADANAAYVDAAADLPYDPEAHRAVTPEWDPHGLDPAVNDIAAVALVDEIKNIDPGDPNAEDTYKTLAARLDAHSREVALSQSDQPDDEMCLAARDHLWDANAKMAKTAEIAYIDRYDGLVDPAVTREPGDFNTREDILHSNMPVGADDDPAFTAAMAEMSDEELAATYARLTAASGEMHGAAELADAVDGRPEIAAALDARGDAVDTYVAAARAELDSRLDGADPDHRAAVSGVVADAGAETLDKPYTGAHYAGEQLSYAAGELRHGAPSKYGPMADSYASPAEREERGLDPDGPPRAGGRFDPDTHVAGPEEVEERYAAMRRALSDGAPAPKPEDLPVELRRDDDGEAPSVHADEVLDYVNSSIADDYAARTSVTGEDALRRYTDDALKMQRALYADGREDDAKQVERAVSELPYSVSQAELIHNADPGMQARARNKWGHMTTYDGPEEVARGLGERAEEMGLFGKVDDHRPGSMTDIYTPAHVARDAKAVVDYIESNTPAVDPDTDTFDSLRSRATELAERDNTAAEYVGLADVLTGTSSWRGTRNSADDLRDRSVGWSVVSDDLDSYDIPEGPIREAVRDPHAPLSALSNMAPDIVSAEVDRRVAAEPVLSADAARLSLAGDIYGEGPGDARSLMENNSHVARQALSATQWASYRETGTLPKMTRADKAASIDRLIGIIDSHHADEAETVGNNPITVPGHMGEDVTTTEPDLVDQVHARLRADYAKARQDFADGDDSAYDRVVVIAAAASSENFYHDTRQLIEDGDVTFVSPPDPNQQTLF